MAAIHKRVVGTDKLEEQFGKDLKARKLVISESLGE